MLHQDNPTASGSHWGLNALTYAREVCSLAPGRGSATEGEARAAGYVAEKLDALGVAAVIRQPFSGLRSIWIFLSMAFGFALAGHAAFWLLPTSVGALPAAGVMLLGFAFSAYLLWRKFTFRDYPLRQALPHGPSQNVIARLPPEGILRHQVVLVGHLDSHRAVLWYANDYLLKLYALSAPVAVYGVLLAPLFYSLAAITAWQFLAWLGVILGIIHFLAWLSGVTADLGPYSPGANDNASAVGSLLALAERLQQEPLQHTQVWLLFSGCEETGCDGMRFFLKEHGQGLKEALFIDFELVGIGDCLYYLRNEGLLHRQRIAVEVEQRLVAAGEGLDLRPVELAGFGAFTEIGTVWEYGHRGACLSAGFSTKRGLPEWHRLTDQPERLQAETLERVQALTWRVLRTIDAE